MTTEKGQSANHRMVRRMVVAVIACCAIAFALYGFAAWSAATINCAESAATPQDCGGARRALLVFGALSIAMVLGAVVAWRKLDA